MSNTDINLSDGSMVAVVLGRNYRLPKDVADHPQLAMFDGLAKYPTGALPPIPTNVKAIAYTGGLALDRTQALQAEAKRRNILYISRNNDAALTDVLRHWLATGNKKGIFPGHEPANGVTTNGEGPPPPHEPLELQHPKDEARKILPRGSLQDFVKEHLDLKHATSTAQEGRRLFDLAKQHGLATTVASVTQCVTMLKRRAGAGELPQSLLPKGERERLQALKVLDDAIAGLSLMRDWVETTERRVIELETENKRIKDTIGGLLGTH